MPTTKTRRRTQAKSTKSKANGMFTFPATPANFAPLTPVTFLTRSAAVHPDHVAVIHGPRRITYRQLEERARRLASAPYIPEGKTARSPFSKHGDLGL